jgi:adenylate cyclase
VAPCRILPTMADIFVSCSRSDKARAYPLVAALEAQGWPVWRDQEITPGDEFDALIGAELEAARAVVVVWSQASVDSRWAARARLVEADLALVALAGVSSKLSEGMVTRLEADTDLDRIREDARFKSLMERVKARLAGA